MLTAILTFRQPVNTVMLQYRFFLPVFTGLLHYRHFGGFNK